MKNCLPPADGKVPATCSIGVLALQGDFAEHQAALAKVGAGSFQIRTAAELTLADGLILPGGESTTIAKLIDSNALREPIREFAKTGKPIWGTCAGLILLASKVLEQRPDPLGLMDTAVVRNGFGRQVDSFRTTLAVDTFEGGPLTAVFIRAPYIVETGPDVSILARLESGEIVAARQRNIIATAFHPELTSDLRFHQHVANLAAQGVSR